MGEFSYKIKNWNIRKYVGYKRFLVAIKFLRRRFIMAKVKLAESTFNLIEKGRYVFKIVDVDYNEDFGKMKVSLQTKDGQKHTEQFNLIKPNGEPNEGALKAFSYFARTALNNYNVDEIDYEDLLGCYIEATVDHEEFESNKEAGKMLKSVRLGDYASASSFGKSATKEVAKEEVEDEKEDTDDVDLDDFLD